MNLQKKIINIFNLQNYLYICKFNEQHIEKDLHSYGFCDNIFTFDKKYNFLFCKDICTSAQSTDNLMKTCIYFSIISVRMYIQHNLLKTISVHITFIY